MKKRMVAVIILLIVAVLALLYFMNTDWFNIKENRANLLNLSALELKEYGGCKNNKDCVSQCSQGCVNADWAKSNTDTTECFRAWACSCESDICYTDGRPPKAT